MTRTDSTGAVVNTYTYDPWGKVLSSTEGVSNPYRYAGYRYDETTGLYYLQARYYDAGICRFLSLELASGRLHEPTAQNQYVYCENNPVLMVDYNGGWGREVHYGMTYKWAREIGFNKEDALVIARADASVDKPPYKAEIGRHLNWGPNLPGNSTQSQYAAREKCVAKRTGDLEALGRGLHSVQDAIAHSEWPVANRHWLKYVLDPDKANTSSSYSWQQFYLFNLARLDTAETETKAYLRD